MVKLLHIDITRNEAEVIVVVAGEADCSVGAALAGAVDEAMALPVGSVVIDLSDVTFLGVAAIRALSDAQRRARGRGITLLVRPPRRAARRLLELTGVIGPAQFTSSG